MLLGIQLSGLAKRAVAGHAAGQKERRQKQKRNPQIEGEPGTRSLCRKTRNRRCPRPKPLKGRTWEMKNSRGGRLYAYLHSCDTETIALQTKPPFRLLNLRVNITLRR